MIRLEGVSKYYDDKAAVDSVDLEVPHGSLFGLIGPNGAGKTTTLKMLATLIKPDFGMIHVDGLDLTEHVRTVRRRLGYMPDEFGTFRGLTCEEYLQFFGRSYGLHGPSLTERIEDVVALTDLGALRDEFTSALSTGMRQRLSLAKTLLHDPEILILDEPASGLDPRARIEIRSLLRELGEMGKTIVISSHILADLEEICSNIGIIEQGRVVWQGSIRGGLPAAADRSHACFLQVPAEVRDRAIGLMENLDFVDRVGLEGNEIRAEISGAGTNQLLDALIQAGIEILLFKQEKMDLEALFLQRTRGIVS